MGHDAIQAKIRFLAAWLRAAILTAGVFFLLTCTSLSHYYGRPLLEAASPRPSDVIVLLSSGHIRGPWLTPDAMQRTAGALLLYRQGYAPVIISSGSQGGADQAGVQAGWLKMSGVPAENVIVEGRSSRTVESGREVAAIMKARGFRSAVIVTSELDVPRVRLVFRKVGITPSFLAVPEFKRPVRLLYSTSGYSFFYHASYEYAALAFYKLKGWI